MLKIPLNLEKSSIFTNEKLRNPPSPSSLRRQSLQVFERLNVSPIHHYRKNRNSIEFQGFSDKLQRKSSISKPLKVSTNQKQRENPVITQEKHRENISLNQEEILKKLKEILDEIDHEFPSKEIEIQDYKDYLIWKLCKKLKNLMFFEKKAEENVINHGKTLEKDVFSIHQKIEKTLSNIEMQLEADQPLTENSEKIIKENQIKEGDFKGETVIIEEINNFEGENEEKTKKNLEKPLKNPISISQNDEETQTSEIAYEEPLPTVKYPSDLLIKSLEKVKKHQIYYSLFSKENDVLLKEFSQNQMKFEVKTDEKFINDLTMIKREQIPFNYEENFLKTPQSANCNEFFEEINKKETISGKNRNYFEKIEGKYLEIIGFLSEFSPEIKRDNHWVFLIFFDFLWNFLFIFRI